MRKRFVDDELIALWNTAQLENPTDDGYHFVRCPKCGGSGRVAWYVGVSRIPKWILGGVRYIKTMHRNHPDDWSYFKNIRMLFKICYVDDFRRWIS